MAEPATGAVAPVTVAVATVERPDALARCLDALLAGTMCPAEIVVVDQGGLEATRAAVARAAAPTGTLLRHHRHERRGLSASRNAALALATQPVLAVTDDDCVPDATWVATLAAAFDVGSDAASAAAPPDAVTGRVLPFGEPTRDTYAVSSRTATARVDHRGRVAPWLVGTGANTAVRRAVAERLGGWDERLGVGSAGGAGEDIDFLHRLLRDGGSVRYEPAAIVRHERQPLARRLATRSSYGRGIGACCAAWLRAGDWYATVLLARWLAARGRRAVRAALRGDGMGVREELRVLAGTAAGLRYGFAMAPTPADAARAHAAARNA